MSLLVSVFGQPDEDFATVVDFVTQLKRLRVRCGSAGGHSGVPVDAAGCWKGPQPISILAAHPAPGQKTTVSLSAIPVHLLVTISQIFLPRESVKFGLLLLLQKLYNTNSGMS